MGGMGRKRCENSKKTLPPHFLDFPEHVIPQVCSRTGLPCSWPVHISNTHRLEIKTGSPAIPMLFFREMVASLNIKICAHEW